MAKTKVETEGTKRVTKNGTLVAACDCVHVFQDKQYGAGRRLHNIAALGTKRRCTVCGKTVGI
jgi:hypothetical protein